MSIYSKLSALLTAANTKTGESDTTLTDAVQTLIDGYGQGGGGSTGVLTFDFTKSLIAEEDENAVFVIGDTSISRDSSGLHLAGGWAKLGLSMLNRVIEVEVGETNKATSGTQHGRLVMFSPDRGLILRNGANWAVYGASGWSSNISSDLDFFENSTIRLEVGSTGSTSIYKNNTLLLTATIDSSCPFLTLGAMQNSYRDVTFTKCTVYTAEAYALKVLLGE